MYKSNKTHVGRVSEWTTQTRRITIHFSHTQAHQRNRRDSRLLFVRQNRDRRKAKGDKIRSQCSGNLLILFFLFGHFFLFLCIYLSPQPIFTDPFPFAPTSFSHVFYIVLGSFTFPPLASVPPPYALGVLNKG
ncbi:hypothetical protein, unlikely [Trypanosoma brucei gambiense DAL972]|uniref:Uncharacterized protein n=1 Tax=Trypanosoma brucei gambiense (strain MHOM/CI/86/DAL972) TaxID=679716 RepID=C9ZWF9_TRYB9|nr:hypothetical protein, unlikely [Trypanosoma brucei gambiense DAL972]CBH13748.1 hypothetical protein, unlikely [Trypanosoma brucei gambiense DAL972]|eukprot:XP_011776024.1 hypothetical protein, unlikely [Trypanosoma brucei gambiense DAL972]